MARRRRALSLERLATSPLAARDVDGDLCDLLIANVLLAHGIGPAQLALVLAPYNVLAVVSDRDIETKLAWARFPTHDDAAKALHELHDRPCEVLGRPLFLSWARAGLDKEHLGFHQPVHWLSSDVGSEPPTLPGLCVLRDFITEQEEREIVAFLERHDWIRLRRRSVQHYGRNFDYSNNTAGTAAPAPMPPFATEWLFVRVQGALARLAAEQTSSASAARGGPPLISAEALTQPPVQVTANAYEPGDEIPPHKDGDTFVDPIVALCLLDSVVMDFVMDSRRAGADGAEHDGQLCEPERSMRTDSESAADAAASTAAPPDDASAAVELPRRSLFVMAGAARHDYTHAIAGRRIDCLFNGDIHTRSRRISLTMRWCKEDQ